MKAPVLDAGHIFSFGAGKSFPRAISSCRAFANVVRQVLYRDPARRKGEAAVPTSTLTFIVAAAPMRRACSMSTAGKGKGNSDDEREMPQEGSAGGKRSPGEVRPRDDSNKTARVCGGC